MAGNTSQPSIKRVWGIAKSPELKLTDEELHLLVQAHTGKDSIKALNKRELQTVIRVLGSMKDSVKKSERGKHRGGNTSTENQRKKIYKLTQELGWDKPARVNVLSSELDAPAPCRLNAPDLDFACRASADCLHQHQQVI